MKNQRKMVLNPKNQKHSITSEEIKVAMDDYTARGGTIKLLVVEGYEEVGGKNLADEFLMET